MYAYVSFGHTNEIQNQLTVGVDLGNRKPEGMNGLDDGCLPVRSSAEASSVGACGTIKSHRSWRIFCLNMIIFFTSPAFLLGLVPLS